MNKNLSTEMREYLRYCGTSQKDIAKCNGDTRLYHDLGIYGEIAESYMEVLANHYDVNMENFEFDKFFPPEFIGKNRFFRAFFAMIPFAEEFLRKRTSYKPVTLNRIDLVIRMKRWDIPNNEHRIT